MINHKDINNLSIISELNNINRSYNNIELLLLKDNIVNNQLNNELNSPLELTNKSYINKSWVNKRKLYWNYLESKRHMSSFHKLFNPKKDELIESNESIMTNEVMNDNIDNILGESSEYNNKRQRIELNDSLNKNEFDSKIVNNQTSSDIIDNTFLNNNKMNLLAHYSASILDDKIKNINKSQVQSTSHFGSALLKPAMNKTIINLQGLYNPSNTTKVDKQANVNIKTFSQIPNATTVQNDDLNRYYRSLINSKQVKSNNNTSNNITTTNNNSKHKQPSITNINFPDDMNNNKKIIYKQPYNNPTIPKYTGTYFEEIEPPMSYEEIEKLNQNIKLDNEMKSKYNYTSPIDNFNKWMNSIKSYWIDSRKKKKKFVYVNVKDENIDSYDILHSDDDISLLYDDRLNIKGFINIDKYLQRYSCYNIKLTIYGLDNDNYNEWLQSTSNPCYRYIDNPIVGWNKEVIIRMSGKTKGETEVVFVSPNTVYSKSKRIRNKSELLTYISKHSLPNNFINKFNFSTVFCVCHTCEDPNRSYIECSFGYAGCHGWLHSECIGLGYLNEKDIRKHPSVICPFCTAYLEGTGEVEEFGGGKKFMKEITLQYPNNNTTVNNFQIIESSKPHVKWGNDQKNYYDHSAVVWEQEIVSPKLSKHSYSPINISKNNISSPRNNQIKVVTNTPETISPLGGIFQHRLFQMIEPNITNNVTTSRLSDISSKAPAIIESDSESDSDDDLGYDSDISIGHRIRKSYKLENSIYSIKNNSKYIKVRVVGGWMTPPQQILIPPKRKNNYNKYSMRHKNKNKKYNRVDSNKNEKTKLENHIMTLYNQIISTSTTSPSVKFHNITNEVIRPLHVIYRHKILNQAKLIVSISQNKSNRNIINYPDINNKKEKDITIYPIPLLCGGIRFTKLNITENFSFHKHCYDGIICGFCMNVIDPSTSSKANNKSKANKVDIIVDPLKLDSKSINQLIEQLDKDDLEDSASVDITTANHLTTRISGRAPYPIHQSCAYFYDNINKLIDETLTSITVHIYYDRINDKPCEICSRYGGFLFYCDIIHDSKSTVYLCHYMCYNYLVSTNILKTIKPCKRISTSQNNLEIDRSLTDTQIDDNALKDNDCENDVNKTVTADSKSLFVNLLNKYRCQLCGNTAGIAIRCAMISCTVRAHYLCAQTSTQLDKHNVYKQWKFLNLRDVKNDHTKMTKPLVMFCPIHSTIYNDFYC